MKLAAAAPPPLRSLSMRLLALTVAVVLFTGPMVFLPGLAQERRSWLMRRAAEARIAAVSIAVAREGTVDTATRDELLRLSGAAEIQVSEPGRPPLVLASGEPAAAAAFSIDLTREGLFTGMRRALSALLRHDDRLTVLIAGSSRPTGSTIRLVFRDRDLRAALIGFTRQSLGLAVLAAAVTGGLVYSLVLVTMLRPIRRLTGGIAASADPGRATPAGGGELAAIQREARLALWREARLTALSSSVAKLSHDLRNVLAPAALAADRLQVHPDQAVREVGAMFERAIDQATGLISRVLALVREGPGPLSLAAIHLRQLIAEAAQSAGIGGRCELSNRVGQEVVLNADRDRLSRVFMSLLRNAADAGAGRVEVRLGEPEQRGTLVVEVADNGPGLAEGVRSRLFQPFAASGKEGGAGLGLVIARDLLRAHRGDIVLASTGPEGTVFRLTLPYGRHARAAPGKGTL